MDLNSLILEASIAAVFAALIFVVYKRIKSSRSWLHAFYEFPILCGACFLLFFPSANLAANLWTHWQVDGDLVALIDEGPSNYVGLVVVSVLVGMRALFAVGTAPFVHLPETRFEKIASGATIYYSMPNEGMPGYIHPRHSIHTVYEVSAAHFTYYVFVTLSVWALMIDPTHETNLATSALIFLLIFVVDDWVIFNSFYSGLKGWFLGGTYNRIMLVNLAIVVAAAFSIALAYGWLLGIALGVFLLLSLTLAVVLLNGEDKWRRVGEQEVDKRTEEFGLTVADENIPERAVAVSEKVIGTERIIGSPESVDNVTRPDALAAIGSGILMANLFHMYSATSNAPAREAIVAACAGTIEFLPGAANEWSEIQRGRFLEDQGEEFVTSVERALADPIN